MPITSTLLDAISHPMDIRRHSAQELTRLCQEIREFLIQSISKTGGHIGANLGTIEFTVALHAVFDNEKTPFIFDTGHQGYTHKLLTGRKALFATLNQPYGMSRFLAREESAHDKIDATHAGTALPTAVGMAMANKMDNKYDPIVAVVGDGALVEGMSFEGLNYGMLPGLPLIIVVNDNGMAIAPNVGGVHHLFSSPGWQENSKRFFEGMGYQYLGVPDGHDIAALTEAFSQAKVQVKDRPVVVHVKTIKGKGLPYADTHPYRMHFSMPFHPETGAGASPTIVGETYASVASKTLRSIVEKDKSVVVITPATPYASGLDQLLQDFPDRVIDVGMAEQHAVGMAAGLALEGKKPIVCFQSTFMQRAMDPIIHDLCYMDLPVTLLVVRSGFAGFDGATHHGIYDLSYLQALPNLQIFYAGTRYDLDAILQWRMENPKGPMAILHPYENVRADEAPPSDHHQDLAQPEVIGSPAPICLVGPANCLGTLLKVQEELRAAGQDACVVNIRWIKPFPEEALQTLFKQAKLVVTVEENISTGGLGARVAMMLCDHNLKPRLYRAAIPDSFVRFGGKDELSAETRIDAAHVLAGIQSILKEGI